MVKLRPRTVLSLLAAPFLARAALVPGAISDVATPLSAPSSGVTPAAQHNVDYTTDGNIARLTFTVPRQDDDELFLFSIEAARHPDSSACGTLQLRLNGERLERAWTQNSFGHASSIPSRFNVPAEGTVSQLNHSLSLQTSSFCFSQGSGLDEAETVEVTTFQIFTVDGRHITRPVSGFTTSFVVSNDSLQSELTWFNGSGLVPTTTPEDVSTSPDLRDASIENEILRLNRLEEEFKGVQNLYQGQKKLVDDLSKAELELATTEIKQCESIGCVIKTLYQKTKGCLHLMYLRYGPESGRNDVFNADDDRDCVYAESPASRAKALMSDQILCSTHPESTTSTSATAFSNPISQHLSSTSQGSGNRALHLTLDIVVTLLCLSCLFALLHNRCCNPRTAAERAARREERRTQKAFKRAARRHAIKSWWNRTFSRKDDGRIQDYEEKRAMILSQESVLEEAMQFEINRLRDEAAEGLFAAEEGRRDTSASIRRGRTNSMPSIPPTYRSRASSGRPPSYRSYEEIQSGTRVVNGFRGYAPGDTMSGTTLGSEETLEFKPEESDHTPDTSVFSLSPRPSFETLRTEKSGI